MQSRYVIEISGRPAGIVVAENSAYRFFSARETYAALDRRLFRSAADAEEACRRHTRGQQTPARHIRDNVVPLRPPVEFDAMIGG